MESISNLAPILAVEIPVPKWSGLGITFFKIQILTDFSKVSKYNSSKNLNFQNLTGFLGVNLPWSLHFETGISHAPSCGQNSHMTHLSFGRIVC